MSSSLLRSLDALPVARSTAALLLAGAAVIGFTGGVGAAIGLGSGSQPASSAVAAGAGGRAGGAPAAVQPAAASASCQAGEAKDASGATVSYDPKLVLDGDPATAWRCKGDGKGQKLTLDLGKATAVRELGLVPGYAKTDPADGADRYAENRRLTSVRWSFDDGSHVDQEVDPSPAKRDVQMVKVPVVTTSTVTMEILGSQPGAKDFVAVGTVVVLGS